MYSIGIDIGGMSIKTGLVDEKGQIVVKSSIKTERNPELAVKYMAEQIEGLLKEYNISLSMIDGIGIGCPGTVSKDNGVIDFMNNVGWVKVPIVSIFKKYFDLPVIISNDANVAVLAETLYGVASGSKNCVMFTLGTGVGGGIIIDGKLFEGTDSKGAELGHSLFIYDGEQCSCGRKGCLERYISASALLRQTKKAMEENKDSLMWEYVQGDVANVNGLIPFECAKKGDKTAEKVISNYVAYLSEAIMGMLNVFRPDTFIIGGGISNQGDYLIDRIKSYCEKVDYGFKFSPIPKICVAKLKNDAGIIGAAALLR